MKRKLFKIIMVVIFVGLVYMPILHQNLPSGKVNFSVFDAINSDINERQFNTPYFILTSLKDLFKGDM